MTLDEYYSKQSELSLPDGYYDWAKSAEESRFEFDLKAYDEQERNEIRERLQYIRAYMLHYPCTDGLDYWPSDAPIRYYKSRDKILKSCQLSEIEFNDLEPIQVAIKDLGLSRKPTFEFIAFIYNSLLKLERRGQYTTINERLSKIIDIIDQNPDEKLELIIKAGKHKHEFDNKNFIRSLLKHFVDSDLVIGGLCELSDQNKLLLRYYLLQTVLRNLPITYAKPKRGMYNQAERNLGLSILYLTGPKNNNKKKSPEDYCAKDNNADFDLIMRMFKGKSVPILTPDHI